jgi:hypothetical protein
MLISRVARQQLREQVMKRSLGLSVCMVLLGASVSLASFGTVFYEQPPAFEPPPPAATSTTDADLTTPAPGFPDFQVYDNFSVGSTTLVTDIHWYGAFDGAFPDPPSPIDFEVTFFNDAGGQVGSPVQSFSLDAGTAGVNDGTDVQKTAVTPPVGNLPTFRYDALLPPFELAPGDYWLSILALQQFISSDPDIFDPNWGWHLGSGGDGVAIQTSFDGSDTTEARVLDRAFSLTTTAIPEPGSVAVWLLGLVGLACGTVTRRWFRG